MNDDIIKRYGRWLELRAKSGSSWDELLCYCDHTDRCTCSDPDAKTFKESVDRGAIIEDDPDNGWKSLEI